MSPEDAKVAKLLVVDDDRLVLASLIEGLTEAGYSVSGAAGGAEALRLCAEQAPDLVIMDVRMPEMSGIEAAGKIRRQFDIPVFFLSAFDDQDTVKEAVAEGALGYLVKPVRINQLVTSIEAAVARAANFKHLRSTEENLRTALLGDRNIGIATGLVMERYHVTATEAFEAMRRRARSERRKLAEIAAEIVEAAEKSHLPGL